MIFPTRNRQKSRLFAPSRSSGFLRNSLAFSGREFIGSRLPTFFTSDGSRFPCAWILASIWVWRFDLARRYINNELGKLVGIAGTFAFADGHETIMPQA